MSEVDGLIPGGPWGRARGRRDGLKRVERDAVEMWPPADDRTVGFTMWKSDWLPSKSQ